MKAMARSRVPLAWMTTAALAVLFGLIFSGPAQPAPADVADLAVTIADSPDPVAVGADLTYTSSVRNDGPQEATKVVVVQQLPSQADYLSATITGGTCKRQGNRAVCELPKLGVASTATMIVVVRPVRARTLESNVSVDSVETDPVAANNQASTTTTVTPAALESTCRGIEATVVGTRGSDKLVGTAAPDVVAGLGGGDVILALSGRDLVCAGGGNDRVVGGTAADRVFGGGGSDRLLGRGGPDLLAGNPGRDVLRGNGGADRMRGGSGSDRCVGGGGRDVARSCER